MNSVARINSAAVTTRPNQALLTIIVGAQRAGQGCLPSKLGLDSAAHLQLLQRYIGTGTALPEPSEQTLERSALRQELLELRRDEWQELRDLLLAHRRGKDISEHWLAAIVATACMGSEHLWKDLGLSSRAMLKDLLEFNFPELALRNDRDMRWKKFFYKQLCEQQGGYVCRSPSCEQCPTYEDCFGDES